MTYNIESTALLRLFLDKEVAVKSMLLTVLLLLLFPTGSAVAESSQAGTPATNTPSLSEGGYELLNVVRDLMPRRMEACFVRHGITMPMTRVERRADGRGETVALFVPEKLVLQCGTAPLHWFDRDRQGKRLNAETYGIKGNVTSENLFLGTFLAYNGMSTRGVRWNRLRAKHGWWIPIGTWDIGGFGALLAERTKSSPTIVKVDALIKEARAAKPAHANTQRVHVSTKGVRQDAFPRAVERLVGNDPAFRDVPRTDEHFELVRKGTTGYRMILVRIPRSLLPHTFTMNDALRYYKASRQGENVNLRVYGLDANKPQEGYLALLAAANPEIAKHLKKTGQWSFATSGDVLVPVGMVRDDDETVYNFRAVRL